MEIPSVGMNSVMIPESNLGLEEISKAVIKGVSQESHRYVKLEMEKRALKV